MGRWQSRASSNSLSTMAEAPSGSLGHGPCDSQGIGISETDFAYQTEPGGRDGAGPSAVGNETSSRKHTLSRSMVNGLSHVPAPSVNGTVPAAYTASPPPPFQVVSLNPSSSGPGSPDLGGRGTRRRKGPLTPEAKAKAHLMRKIGACQDCKRRRVSCQPAHHNMSWDEAARKHSPSELPRLATRHLSPAATRSSHEMEVDSPPPHPPSHPPSSRTPLPSGPRSDRRPALTPLPESEQQVQKTAAKTLLCSGRRYSSVHALLFYWQEEDAVVRAGIHDLSNVLEGYYHYTCAIKDIPSSPDGYHDCLSPNRWLSREIAKLIDQADSRDSLKIVYYSGLSFLDRDREMVLAFSDKAGATCSIRWSSIQNQLVEARSDILVIMDAAYYPCQQPRRTYPGALELIAASAGEHHTRLLGRNTFTRALTEQLRTRAGQTWRRALSAAELHVGLLAAYPRMVQERHPEAETLATFPAPLHMHLSGTDVLPSLPSIWLVPDPPLSPPPPPASNAQLIVTFQLADELIDSDAWSEWLKLVPEGVRHFKVDGPFRKSFP